MNDAFSSAQWFDKLGRCSGCKTHTKGGFLPDTSKDRTNG